MPKVSGIGFTRYYTTSACKVISNFHVEGPVELPDANCASSVTFKDCVFHGTVKFNSVYLRTGVNFEDCHFQQDVIFSSVQADGYDATIRDFHSVIFRRCKFEGPLVILNSKLERGVLAERCSMGSLTVFEGLEIHQSGLELVETEIADLHIRGATLNGVGLRIHACNVSGWFRIDSLFSPQSRLTVTKSTFRGSVQILEGKVGGVAVNESEFEEGVSISGMRNTGALTFFRSIFREFIEVSCLRSGVHRDIVLRNSRFLAGLEVNGGGSQSESVSIHYSPYLQGSVHLKSISVGKLVLKGDNQNTNTILESVKIQRLHLIHFNNHANLVFSSCRAFGSESEMRIEKSNLRSTQLLSVDLESFEKVLISNSILSKIEFTQVRWFPDEALANHNPQPASVRDIYRQLRVAAENQDDRVQALVFRSRELHWLWREMQGRKRWDGDKIILLLSATNNHGQSWIKPLILLLVVNLVFYALMVLGASQRITFEFMDSKNDLLLTWDVLRDDFHVFFQLINPTRNLSFVFDAPMRVPNLVYFVDAVQRVVLAFFIVQIVSAFRKYFKS